MSGAAQVTVTGVVTDEAGEPLIGATVLEKGKQNGAATDIDGNFKFNVSSSNATLMVSYVGYATQEVKLNGKTNLTIVLKEDSQVLEDVVVVGYGTQKKSDITGSVASLSEAQMKQSIVTNADQMLQGKVAGVQVTQNSGAPGGATSVRIRGASSLNSSNEPLYVIDGVPMSGSSDIGGFDWMGGSNGQTKVNPLAAIAPSDIVSIDVLKDASACAIYGAAGANGVVLVTTRRGSAGHTNVTYDGYVAWQQVAKRLDMMDLREYALYQQQLLAEGVLNKGNFDSTYSDISLLGKGTDWQDEIFRTAFMQSHQVSVTGGNEKTVYAMSGGWMQQDGTIIGSDFSRFNTRFNIDNNFTKWLKIGGALAYTRTDETITRNDGSDGVIMQAMTMMPSVPVYDYDGNWAGPNTVNGASTWNPVALAMMTNNTLLRQKINGNFYVSADFLKHFTFRAEYAFDASQNQNKSFIPRYQFGLVSNDINQMMQREDHNFFWMQKDYLTYNQTFNEKHDVTAMVGFEVSKGSWNGTQFIKNNFTSDNIHIMGSDGDFVSNTGWSDANSSASVFARVNYGFDNRYLLTATVRRDGSSKFGPKNKWGTFPSVALAWRLIQEKWLQDVNWISNLKLRLGYGKVGNSNISTYLYGSSLQTILTPMGSAYIPSNLSNPNLKWEASEQYNVGLDFAAFSNRLELTVDGYIKQTQDLLMQTFVPSHIGSNSWGEINTPYANIGKTRNVGIDVQINARPVITRDFMWSSSLTLSHNRNKIVALNDDSQRIYGNIDWWAPFQTVTMFAVGQPMGVFYGYETEGLFQNEADILGHASQTGSKEPYSNKIDKVSGAWIGDLKFKDQNGDGVINDADQKIIGDPNPDLTFGFTNTFSWKNFELNVGLTGQIGGDILNWARYRTEGLSSIWDNQAVSVLNRAQTEKIDPNGSDDISNLQLAKGHNGIPRFSNLDANGNQRMSDRWLEDASYLRIQNISLTYNLPEKWAKKVFMQSARIYFNVQNVYTFTNYSGYDPEIGAFNQSSLLQNIDRGRYPTPRTYTIGLNLSF
ncbi:TonB-dependent receptor [Muribaculaceae bacterium Isolate-037 (Harlan)]|uniref:TonB-dependent receptor n=2 Tax=Lepagella muris TaxID=3032870 RepID=A0AC61RCJ7_9BACT|nr:TonB-dependent receptor [Muribaculaceae bacterium Isolate-037 (Harlan)]TGY77727.1 TonB-dependent receptor [Lepagella muris]THG50670.1 TonB-dependent receptor [Bacteroidales bacterium]TKC55943.1 TonB-dependent receptor [Bacteroidales bacterium]